MLNNAAQIPKLLTFASVAKHGSFTKAAQLLGLSKSAVSQQVKSLELELGVRLLNRTTRGMSLTAIGEQLLARCVLIQDQIELIFSDIEQISENPSGKFSLTFPHALETGVILPAIEQLCSEYPGLEPELIVSDETLDLIANDLDVAIHAGVLPDSSYRALPIGKITEIFCATPRYLSGAASTKLPADLCNHPWISTIWQQSKVDVFDVKTHEKTTIELKHFSHVNTLPSALGMALRHMGIILLPDIIANPLLKTGELVQIARSIGGADWPIHLLHAYEKGRPIHITRFHSLIKRAFSDALIIGD